MTCDIYTHTVMFQNSNTVRNNNNNHNNNSFVVVTVNTAIGKQTVHITYFLGNSKKQFIGL